MKNTPLYLEAAAIIDRLWEKGISLGFHPDSDLTNFTDGDGRLIFSLSEGVAMNDRVERVMHTAEDGYALFFEVQSEHYAAAIRKYRPLSAEEEQWLQDRNLLLLHRAYEYILVEPVTF
ncbi:MAG TPA: hypothetical protein VGH19_06880 [Verrucomicrobiae bacterium]